MISLPKKKLKWRIVVLATFFIGLVGVRLPMAQDVTWVTAEGTAPLVSGDKKKARDQAIMVAERNAVADTLAAGLSIETLLVNLRLSGSFVEAIPFGRVAKKQILEEGPIKSIGSDSTNKNVRYRVRMKAGVVRETSGKDPSFNLHTTINQTVFKDGDELIIRIRSTKDCYLAIYNILEDKTIMRLLPNYLSNKTFLEANETFVFPKVDSNKKDLNLRIHLPKNKDAVTESIFVLALAHPFELEAVEAQEGIYGVFNGHTASMKDLIRAVVGIPSESRAEALMQYEIRKIGKSI